MLSLIEVIVLFLMAAIVARVAAGSLKESRKENARDKIRKIQKHPYGVLK